MTAQKPLPERMRPDDPDLFLGQSHLASRLKSLMAAERLPTGGTAMYALLALAGDMGCSAGPGLVGQLQGPMPEAGGAKGEQPGVQRR